MRNTSYDSFVKRSVTLLLNKEGIEVIKPVLIPPIDPFDYETIDKMYDHVSTLSNSALTRYSVLPDELQVKYKIVLKNLWGLTLPTREVCKTASIDYYIEVMVSLFLRLKEMLESYDYQLPIYDLKTTKKISSPSDIEKIYLKKF